MKRDMELIRLLLIGIEQQDPDSFSAVAPPGYSEEQINYHITLLIEAGLLKGQIVEQGMGQTPTPVVDRLTWNGHEFLANAENDSVWNKVMAQVKQHGMSVSLEVLKELLVVAVRGVVSQGP